MSPSRCPRCRRGAVMDDGDDRAVCINCGEAVFDEPNILEKIGHNVSGSDVRSENADVAARAGGIRTATRHHGADDAWDVDDGYRYGFNGERTARRTLGSADR